MSSSYSLRFIVLPIAYHVELNTPSGCRRDPANDQKWMHYSGKIPWNRGDPSGDVDFRFLFRWLRIWNLCLVRL